MNKKGTDQRINAPDVAAHSSEHKHLNEDLACDQCGRFGAIDFGDQRLCPDCYATRGSCCPEFGRDEPNAEKSRAEERQAER
jgi:hypothetical protein